MIIAKTRLKKIPDKCTNCRLCAKSITTRHKLLSGSWDWYKSKRCLITGAEVPYVYNEKKRNWEFTKCKTCPLSEVTK